ncbi:MAG TPA: hypothetical protein VIY53_19765 [Acidobacteriaceae bacterium]
MAFPIKTCAVCGEEFELKPDKPGFANRCPSCSEPEGQASAADTAHFANSAEVNEARRRAIRDMLYRKES